MRARALVTLKQVLTQLLEVPAAQRPLGGDHALVLTDHVIRARVLARSELITGGLELRWFHGAQGLHAEHPGCVRAVVAKRAGLRFEDGVQPHRVAHDHGHFSEQRQRLDR